MSFSNWARPPPPASTHSSVMGQTRNAVLQMTGLNYSCPPLLTFKCNFFYFLAAHLWNWATHLSNVRVKSNHCCLWDEFDSLHIFFCSKKNSSISPNLQIPPSPHPPLSNNNSEGDQNSPNKTECHIHAYITAMHWLRGTSVVSPLLEGSPVPPPAMRKWGRWLC